MAPFNVLAGGKIRSDEEEQRRKESGEKGRQMLSPQWERTPDERKVCLALEEVAKEVGVKSITAVAIAYVMQKTPYVFPIIGGRKVEHFKDNLKALDISLSPKQIAYLESILPFDKGFPYTFFVSSFVHSFRFYINARSSGRRIRLQCTAEVCGSLRQVAPRRASSSNARPVNVCCWEESVEIACLLA